MHHNIKVVLFFFQHKFMTIDDNVIFQNADVCLLRHVVKHGVESGVYFGVELGVNFGVFFFYFFSKMHFVSFKKIVIIILPVEGIIIRVITKLPNSEQSYKGKVKTHNYINRQNQSTTGKL